MTITETAAAKRTDKTPAKNGNFYQLQQDGLLGTTNRALGPGSIARSVFRENPPSTTDKTKTRQIRAQVRGLLGVDSFAQVADLLKDPEAQQRARDNAYELIGNMYGIQKKPARKETTKERKERINRIKEQVEDFAQTANGVVERLSTILDASPVGLNGINVVKDTFDPVDLLLITLDDRYGKRVRFEAKRKLVLMNLAAKIDQREREIHLNRSYRRMNRFLDDFVFNSDEKVGEVQDTALLSDHDPDTFATSSVTATTPQEVMQVELHPGQKVTPLLQRSFIYRGDKIPVQIDTRKKDPVSKVLKLLRKGKESPAEAMGDEVGFMAIFRNPGDIRRFKRHLNESGLQAGTLLDMQDIENTLDGSPHEPKSAGSSSHLRQDKSHITLNGITIEAICHTFSSYTDYLYRNEVGHDEFEAARYFDSGVVSLLFPTDIYHYDEAALKEDTISGIRKKIAA